MWLHVAVCVCGYLLTPYRVRNYVAVGVNKWREVVGGLSALNLRVEGSIPSRFKLSAILLFHVYF